MLRESSVGVTSVVGAEEDGLQHQVAEWWWPWLGLEPYLTMKRTRATSGVGINCGRISRPWALL